MNSIPNIFSPCTLGSLELRNRLVRSATWAGMADPDSCVTPQLVELYRQLAEGGAGLLISGFINVLQEGNPFPSCMGLFDDRQIVGMQQLAQTVHQAGSKLCLQLSHGGGQGSSKTCGEQPQAPSAVQMQQFPERPAEMSVEDIQRTVAAFAAAAARARQADCDAVQLHAAHGYLINQFLSPHTNQRQDEYGGDLNGRSRFLQEVVTAIQTAVGKDFPLLVKLNGSDNIEGGLTLADATEISKTLSVAGVAAIEVSSGTPASGDQGPVRKAAATEGERAYNAVLSRTIRQEVNCPVIIVGGIRSLQVMDGLLRTGQADLISVCRPLIREPDLPNRLQQQRSEGSTCISCNGCFKTALRGNLRCVIPKDSDGTNDG